MRFKTHEFGCFNMSCQLELLQELRGILTRSDRPLLLKELKEKKWAQRWYEQEAVYVTERIYRSLIYQKKYSKRRAHGLVRKIAYRPNTPVPFCFKQMALEPYAKTHGFIV